MRWPKFSIAKFRRLLVGKRTPVGASCAYLQWTKYVGLKMYSERGQRTRCWRRQRKAARHGLGPSTGGCFEFRALAISWGSFRAPDFRWKTIYCYWTEHVQVNSKLDDRDYDTLYSGLLKLGYHHKDLVPWNTGTTRDSRVVCIDFDSCSCGAA
jgi:hypothetical protein